MLLNSKGRLLDLNRPLVMAVVNVTPDSFYAGSRFKKLDSLLFRVEQMLSEGASIIDIGGASTKPGSEIIKAEMEIERVLPAISAIKKRFPDVFLSLDTYNALTLEAGIQAGIDLVNDISAFSFDEDYLDVLSGSQLPYVLMHMQGQPENMQNEPTYNNTITEVYDFFHEKLSILKAHNVKDVILDPGFGFGKSIEHNYKLLNHMNVFQEFDCSILAGVSRKSMICKLLNVAPTNALNGTSVLHLKCLQMGAKILRVHDVKEAIEVIKLWDCMEQNKRI